ncbi:META domain-containing protein [Pseudomonas sp. S09G 359]|jgi:heat shock protein HslJ|uniref:META domain-containing protein n=1 Tax=Pseudomonas sp. S09G 359 TaxID=2054919 RepID=UPI000C6D7491|nr:META domain-containing protein [Pseudomonas sp. S09G 359]AUG08527.1 META domain-containing protein [Pseudomonas sp. S09G 359]
MKRLLLLAAFGVALTGCAGDAVKLKQDHSYVVEWIGERPLMDYAHLTVTLGADGRAYGSGGCNHWFAPYTLDGDSLSFGKIGSTRKLCAEALMEQEHRFFQALQGVQRWDISPIAQTRFWPAEGAPIRLWLEEG